MTSKSPFKLCYVADNIAYFTTQPLEQQHGDDWDDVPYECNAGSPYSPTKDFSYPEKAPDETFTWKKGSDYTNGLPNWQILEIVYRADLQLPHEGPHNSSYSVEQINRGAVAWLVDRWGDSKVVIPAGVSPEMFKGLIRRAGGTVYKEDLE